MSPHSKPSQCKIEISHTFRTEGVFIMRSASECNINSLYEYVEDVTCSFFNVTQNITICSTVELWRIFVTIKLNLNASFKIC